MIKISTDWQRLYGEPLSKATFRQELEDFEVHETLRFEPSGEGAHHFLYIEKRDLNTDAVAQKLCRFAQVKPLDIGYAGKKDRFAVARQWFSVQLPLLKVIDWNALSDHKLRLLKATRHDKKLRIGAVKSNQFTIRLRNLSNTTEFKAAVGARIQNIIEKGFPNYFGEQRFGRDFQNLKRGFDLLKSNKRLKNRSLQGLLYSAVRSYFFNHLVSERISQNLYDKVLEGDYVQLDGSEKGFLVDDLSLVQSRFQEKDVHITAPLVGSGSTVTEQSLEFQRSILTDYTETIDALARKGLKEERRACRAFPENVIFDWHNDELDASKCSLALNFTLGKGVFATSLLREIFDCVIEI